MLGYGLMPYRPASAKETTMWPLIALAAQKRHLSLYVCAVVDGQYLAESRAAALGWSAPGGVAVVAGRPPGSDADANARPPSCTPSTGPRAARASRSSAACTATGWSW